VNLKLWRVIMSGRFFGQYTECALETNVWGQDAAEAERSARAQGITNITWWKFERVEEVVS
jgi:hypothetical protein